MKLLKYSKSSAGMYMERWPCLKPGCAPPFGARPPWKMQYSEPGERRLLQRSLLWRLVPLQLLLGDLSAFVGGHVAYSSLLFWTFHGDEGPSTGQLASANGVTPAPTQVRIRRY